jgi:hypothetical protein
MVRCGVSCHEHRVMIEIPGHELPGSGLPLPCLGELPALTGRSTRDTCLIFPG